MPTDRRFDFEVNAAEHTITVSREFKGGRQLVWDCHTKQEYLDQWFAPKGLTTRTKHMDFSEGGFWHYAMLMPDGQAFWSRLDYLTIKPIDSYTALDGFTDETGVINAEMPRAEWDATFTDAPQGTLVTTVVKYKSASDVEKVIAMGMKAGMTSTLERLDDLLEKIG